MLESPQTDSVSISREQCLRSESEFKVPYLPITGYAMFDGTQWHIRLRHNRKTYAFCTSPHQEPGDLHITKGKIMQQSNDGKLTPLTCFAIDETCDTFLTTNENGDLRFMPVPPPLETYV